MQPSGGLCLLFNMRFRVQIFQVNFPSFIFLIPKIMYPILDGIRKKKGLCIHNLTKPYV